MHTASVGRACARKRHWCFQNWTLARQGRIASIDSGDVAQALGQLDRDTPWIDHRRGRHVVHRRILAIRLRELDALGLELLC